MVQSHRLAELIDKPEQLESLYRQAVREGWAREFQEAIETLYANTPDNMLLAAWHYRLAAEASPARARVRSHWLWAVVLAVVNALVFWAISDLDRFRYRQEMPHFFLLWAPIAAVFIMAFLYAAGQRSPRRFGALTLALAVVTGYVYVADWWIQADIFWRQYLTLGGIHLVLMAWAAVGLYVLIGQSDVESRFAFLVKSLEVVVIGGLFAIVLGLFTGITFTLFDALRVYPSDVVYRLFFMGGSGLVPVLAVATVYDPLVPMREQNFRAGISIFVSLLLRIFVPLSILVLLVYIGFIPFRFMEPFYHREALIGYNVMLFAVVGLLLGATPAPGVPLGEAQARWLRRGLVTVAALALIVSVYALAAIIFRTWWDGFTPNRITVIGWNLVNIAFLAVLLYRQSRATPATWIQEIWRNFAQWAVVYPVWGLVLLLSLPWFF